MQRMPSIPVSPRRQRGATLFVVIVFVLLSMLLALWASRTALFNELVVGNDADYQRAYEAAQALLQDAELDIRGESADGSACTPDPNSTDVCRVGTADRVPVETAAVGSFLSKLELLPTRCRNGQCAKRVGRQDFWNLTPSMTPTPPADPLRGEVRLDQLTQPGVGARYGQYTGAGLGSTSAPANPILADTSAPNRGGWYWIEVLPYSDAAKSSGLIVPPAGAAGATLLPLNLVPNVVYRITALAYGRRPNTVVVLQQSYAQQKLKD